MGLESRYDSKAISKLWGDTQRMIAVIVGEVTQLQTQPFGKFDYDVPDVVAQRYRIRILGQDPPDKDESMLPVAYANQNNSGLGAQDTGIIRYTPNTYVYVSKSDAGYLIEKVVPNYISAPLVNLYGGGTQALSGFLPDSTVPQSYTLKGDFNHAELFGAQAPSDEDIRMVYNTKLPTFTSACKPVNTQGINDSINNLVQQIEGLKTGLTGEDSFLATSGKFISDAQNTINGAQLASGINIGGESYDITLGNAAGDIAQIIAALIQEMRKFVLRKTTTIVNNLIGNVPLSARYLANEGTDKALGAISCLFYRILQGLEGMIGNILSSFINKIINASTCLVENLLGGLIGNIIGNIVGAINSLLSSIGETLGTAIDFAVDILNFVISILDIAKCPVKNECPQTDQWDFLNGSSAPKAVLDFNNIFEQAKGIVGSVSESVNDITATADDLIDDFNFSKSDGSPFDPLGDINVGSIWQSVIDGSCNTGAVDCGPPDVVFWGGNGSGASGNAVVNAVGEVLGVQIITPGNYTSPPLMEFQDACGNGKGASGTTVLGPVPTGKKPDHTDPGGDDDDDDDGNPTDPDGDDGDGNDDGGFGVIDVIINDSGYGYEGFPYGDKGGSGRVWANRCQSTVLRANYDWDIPYSSGRTVTVFYGDTVKLPGKNAVVIDENFTEDLIPGCIINGVNPRLKDMTNFDYTYGKVYENGIRHQFGLLVDAQRAFASGFTEQDIRFFLENKFFLRVGPRMREKLLDPNWGRIPEFSVTFTAPGCPPGTPEDPNQPPTNNFDDGEDVISILEGVVIQNPGFGYDGDDTLNIPGAEGNLIIDNGAITGVIITNPGIGYTNLPEIKINTATGFNAIIKPVLRFVNPNDAGFVVPLGTPVLQVIDCVGKV